MKSHFVRMKNLVNFRAARTVFAGFIFVFSFGAFNSRAYSQDDSTAAKNIVHTIGNLNSKMAECTQCEKAYYRKPANEKQIWEDAGIKNVAFYNLDYTPGDVGYDPVIDLSVVVIRHTDWQGPEIQDQIDEINNVYKQCGIHIGKVKLVYIEPPTPRDINIYHSAMFHGDDDRRVAEQMPTYLEKPVIYFVHSNLDGEPGWSYPPVVNTLVGNALTNTIWLTHELESNNAMEKVLPCKVTKQCSISAHEIAHLLMNTISHFVGGTSNILTDDGRIRNNRIVPVECATMRKNAYKLMKAQKKQKQLLNAEGASDS